MLMIHGCHIIYTFQLEIHVINKYFKTYKKIHDVVYLGAMSSTWPKVTKNKYMGYIEDFWGTNSALDNML